jgi:hypothetical protein
MQKYGFVLNLQNKMADFSAEMHLFSKIIRPHTKMGPNILINR